MFFCVIQTLFGALRVVFSDCEIVSFSGCPLIYIVKIKNNKFLSIKWKYRLTRETKFKENTHQ